MKALKIGNLFAPVPIVQGGMGVGISLSGLASAVAEQGGIGVISSAGLGVIYSQRPHDYREASIRGLREELRKAREATKGIIGVNVMVAMSNFADMVRTAIAEKADIIFSGAGLPLNLPSFLTEGAKTKLAPIVSSARAAGLLCRKWFSEYNYIPDAIVVEGPKAGGHLGFDRKQLEDIGGLHYEAEAARILEFVRGKAKEAGKPVPVVMAGGIYDRQDADPWLKLGMDGVQMATRFVTTWECDAAQAYKDAYLNAEKEDIVLVKSPVGMPGRAIRNAFLERAQKGRIPHGPCHGCIKTCSPADTPYCITEALVNAVKGDVDNGLIFCGNNAWRAQRMEHVKDIMAEFS